MQDFEYAIVCEETSPIGTKCEILDVKDNLGQLQYLKFRSCMQDFGLRNRNGRLWNGRMMQQALQAPHILELLEKMTINPANFYKLDAGTIEEGKFADLVIFDENEEWIVPEKFASKASNTPFIGEKLYGKVKYTICNGKIVYRD